MMFLVQFEARCHNAMKTILILLLLGTILLASPLAFAPASHKPQTHSTDLRPIALRPNVVGKNSFALFPIRSQHANTCDA